jgi:hypothetical protein
MERKRSWTRSLRIGHCKSGLQIGPCKATGVGLFNMITVKSSIFIPFFASYVGCYIFFRSTLCQSVATATFYLYFHQPLQAPHKGAGLVFMVQSILNPAWKASWLKIKGGSNKKSIETVWVLWRERIWPSKRART